MDGNQWESTSKLLNFSFFFIIQIKREFLQFVGEKLKIKKFEGCFTFFNFSPLFQDWYEINPLDVRKLGGSAFLTLYGDFLWKAIEVNFPEFYWKPWLVCFS